MSERAVFFVPELREPKDLMRDLLTPHGEIREGGESKWSEDDLVRGAPEWDAIIVSSREKITAPVLEAASRLKVVSKIGVGVENIDVPAATRRGVMVTNCPGSNAVAVGEMTLGLMLAVVRRIPQNMQLLRGGAWRHGIPMVRELTGATFGLVGFGNTARQFLRVLRGFEGRILVHDPHVAEEQVRAAGGEPVDLDTLTKESDVVSLHVVLTPETRHMFDAARLRMMKPHAVILNTSRGPAIDTAALVEALREGVIAGAGVDVFDEEPPPKDHPLFSLPNAVVSPHQAGSSHEARDRMYRMAAENAIRVVRGEGPDRAALVNPEVRG